MYREIVSRVSSRCLIDSLRDGRREGERGPVFHFIQWSGKIQIAPFVPDLEISGRYLGVSSGWSSVFPDSGFSENAMMVVGMGPRITNRGTQTNKPRVGPSTSQTTNPQVSR